ncbi:MAG: glycogen-binding domain-containing protein [Myxococcota bacterium]|nr:glycogen-binding domain-containing protein [Myxococcota bacterium]
MLLLLLTVGSTQAAPTSMLASAQATGIVGMEQWSGAPSAISGIRTRVGLHHRQEVLLRGALSSEVLWWAGSPYDLQLSELAITGLGSTALGGSVVASGSFASGFSEITPALTGHHRTGSHNLQLQLGPSLRMSPQLATGMAPGGGAAALWSIQASPSFSVWALLNGDLWSSSSGLPEGIITSDLGARWHPRPPLILSSSMGISATGGQTAGWVAGLPPSDSRILRGRLTVERRLHPHLGIRGELLGDRGMGSLSHRHTRITIGLTAQLRHRRSTPGPPEVILFSIVAPDATTVEILGSFSDWRPVPLAQAADGSWRTELSLAAGIYEYIYRVDGQPRTPPEAKRYQDDGFGGRNGVLIVGE